MTELELKRRASIFLFKMAEVFKQDYAYRNEIIDGVVHISLDGFRADVESFAIADDLEIGKAPAADKFFDRLMGIELPKIEDYKKSNNFFATFKCPIAPPGVEGPSAADRIMMMAIFFSVCSKHFVKIREGDAFLCVKEKLSFLGKTSIAEAPFGLTANVYFKNEDLEELKKYWPAFRDQFYKYPLFALTVRRFYFTLLRNQWEDKLLDILIVLEAFFASAKIVKVTEVIQRLSVLLAKHHDLKVINALVKKSYKVRYKLIMGERSEESQDKNYQLVMDLTKLLKTALQVYLADYAHMNHQDFIAHLDANVVDKEDEV